MKKIVILLSLMISTIACATPCKKYDPLPTAKNVDVGRYIGKWYAVSSLPQFFTRSCLAQTAEYGIIGDGEISVLNTCLKKGGKTKTIEGKAVVANKATNAELIVTFNNFWTKLFRVKGDYTIMKLSEGYDTVLVASKDRKSLWIMSRTPSIDEQVLTEYTAFAKANGFDTDKLERAIFE